MAISRKRKHAVADETPTGKQTNPAASQKNIKDFGSAGKPVKEPQSQKKRKIAREATPQPQSAAPSSANKRKRDLDSVAEEEDEQPVKQSKTTESIFARFAKPKTDITPQASRFQNALPPSPAQTPSKNAAQLFDRLNLRATSPAVQAYSKHQRAYDTPPATPESERVHDVTALPEELQDFVRMHSAFLTALGLHYAHNGGSIAAVNTKLLLPSITANWRKRSVTINDLRKMLAIGQSGAASFMLEDRGKAGIFLSSVSTSHSARKRSAGLLDEAELTASFEAALVQVWQSWCAETAKELQTGRAFIRQLSLGEISKYEAAEKAASLFSRGQQRLTDLKNSQATAKAEVEKERAAVKTEEKSTAAVQNRGASLLDRVLAKQAHAASLPSGPTKTELERKSALHRVEDVARVLELLAAGKPRVSFSMPTVTQQLQQSLRNPISREEVERCLDIMAAEIMPTFVQMIASGTVKGVVVTKAGKIGFADLKERLANAGA